MLLILKQHVMHTSWRMNMATPELTQESGNHYPGIMHQEILARY
jgi:hypothetical protein